VSKITKINEKLLFAPNCKFKQLRTYIISDSRNKIIEAFKDRVNGFYLNQAKKLNEHWDSFIQGAICVICIDFLARIEYNSNRTEERIVNWLTTYINDSFDERLAKRFYKEFRNGLVHEGRIKNGSYFSNDSEKLVNEINDFMGINSQKLIDAISESFNRYIEKLRTDEIEFLNLRRFIIRDFKKELQLDI